MSGMTMGGAGSVFAWTLVHSVWQAAIVAGGLSIVLRLIPGSMTRVRTAAASASLALVLGLAVATWLALDADWRAHDACWSSESYALSHPARCASHGMPLPADALGVDDAGSGTRVVLPWAWITLSGIPGARTVGPMALATTNWLAAVVVVWLALALIGLARLVSGFRKLRGVVRRSRPIEAPGPRDLLRDVARRRGLTRNVDLRVSSEIATPAVSGWRRPVILLPIGMCGALAPEQLGCVFAHELVHVEREHFALNFFQRALECFLVISPGALCISRRIREEREAMCDRVAAGSPAAGRRDYVETLLRLESLRSPAGPALIGLLGEGPLLRRVRRLVHSGATRRRERLGRGIAAALVAAVVLGVVVEIGVSAAAVSSWAMMAHDIHRREVPEFEVGTPAAKAELADLSR
jgi:beta-lactamase regulating signal transducer with metallopeptidase domain